MLLNGSSLNSVGLNKAARNGVIHVVEAVGCMATFHANHTISGRISAARGTVSGAFSISGSYRCAEKAAGASVFALTTSSSTIRARHAYAKLNVGGSINTGVAPVTTKRISVTGGGAQLSFRRVDAISFSSSTIPVPDDRYIVVSGQNTTSSRARLRTLVQKPGEKLDYDIDYKHWLAVNDHITNVSASVEPANVGTSSHDGLRVPYLSHHNGVVRLWAEGGVSGVTYRVMLTVKTLFWRTKRDTIKFKIKEE